MQQSHVTPSLSHLYVLGYLLDQAADVAVTPKHLEEIQTLTLKIITLSPKGVRAIL
ncbi:predicted protein [Botrytis cinerea T4]|uniref:Uncharacterized protein n=1 Tax=Botryotinia fuckeliana (strain T4) TaxID=999810 RepID=G2XRZ6_BOTF4|nr:predicted protein [Botrytis cinerea T4]